MTNREINIKYKDINKYIYNMKSKNLNLLGLRVITSNMLVKQQHEAKNQNPIVELINKTTYQCESHPNANAERVGICLETPVGKNSVEALESLDKMCVTASICDKLTITSNGIFTNSKVLACYLVKNGYQYIPEKSAIVTFNT